MTPLYSGIEATGLCLGAFDMKMELAAKIVLGTDRFANHVHGIDTDCGRPPMSISKWKRWRNSEATETIELGRVDGAATIVTVQQLLGHSSITVTMGYTHTNLDSKRTAVARLENYGDNLVTVPLESQQKQIQMSELHRQVADYGRIEKRRGGRAV